MKIQYFYYLLREIQAQEHFPTHTKYISLVGGVQIANQHPYGIKNEHINNLVDIIQANTFIISIVCIRHLYLGAKLHCWYIYYVAKMPAADLQFLSYYYILDAYNIKIWYLWSVWPAT